MTHSIRILVLMLGIATVQLFTAPVAMANETHTHIDQDKVHGVKSKLLTQAVKVMAKAIRKGDKPFFEVCEKLGADRKALQAFRKHAGKIADVLDDIAKIPDLVLDVVGAKIFFMLTTDRGPIKMDPGSAKLIEKVVVGVINALI